MEGGGVEGCLWRAGGDRGVEGVCGGRGGGDRGVEGVCGGWGAGGWRGACGGRGGGVEGCFFQVEIVKCTVSTIGQCRGESWKQKGTVGSAITNRPEAEKRL